MDIAQAFNVALHVPSLSRPEIKMVLQQLGAFRASNVSGRARLLLGVGRMADGTHLPAHHIQGSRACYRFGNDDVEFPKECKMAVCCAPLRMQLDVAVQELGDVRMPMKKLLLLVDLARQGLQPGQEDVSLQRWTAVVQDLGIQ